MFELLRIKNFQSHKYTELVFVSGVNILIGRPQSGKTAVVRAINLLADNRPRGFRFNSNFSDGEPTEIMLKATGAKRITFTKNKSEASYDVQGTDGFSGIGSNVPDIVTTSLNLSELNFQHQLDKHFLITSSPGEVGRAINRVTRLEKVDGWVSGLTTNINSTNKEIALLEGQHKEFLIELKQYDNLPELEKLVGSAEVIANEIEVLEEQEDELRDIAKKLESINEDIDSFDKWIAHVSKFLDKAESCLNEIEKLDVELGLINQFIELEGEIAKYEKFLEVSDLVGKGEQMADGIKELEKQLDELEVMRVKIEANGLEIDSVAEKGDRVRDGYEELLKDLGACPTCFTLLDGEMIKKILGNV